MGNGNDYHGDAYMQAFQAVLARCPWLPVIGNHESTMGEGKDKVDLSSQQRYLNESWGVIYGQDEQKSETASARTTASSWSWCVRPPQCAGATSTRSGVVAGGCTIRDAAD